MTSPYLIAASARIKRNSHLGTKADYQRRDYFAARTQREAGLDHRDWESRLKPLRPWLTDIIAGLALVGFMIGAFMMSGAAADLLR